MPAAPMAKVRWMVKMMIVAIEGVGCEEWRELGWIVKMVVALSSGGW